MTSRRTPPDEVHSITGTRSGHSDDFDHRVKRYFVTMAVRTGCVVLAVVVDGPLRWVFAAGAVVLPYIAVVMANVSGGRRSAGPEAPTVRPRGALAETETASAGPVVVEGTVVDQPLAAGSPASGPPAADANPPGATDGAAGRAAGARP